MQKPQPFQNEEQREKYGLWSVRRANAEPSRESQRHARRGGKPAPPGPSRDWFLPRGAVGGGSGGGRGPERHLEIGSGLKGACRVMNERGHNYTYSAS